MKITKIHGYAGVDGQMFVQRHLFALVVGERLAKGLGNGAKLVLKGLQHIGRADWIGLWKLYDHEQSAGTLDQSAHGNSVALAFDEVSHPVAGKLPVLDLWRAHLEAEHVRNRASPVLAFAAWRAFITGLGTSWRPVPCAIRPPVERRCSFRWFRVARGAYGPWD